jgi:hypothetical protein
LLLVGPTAAGAPEGPKRTEPTCVSSVGSWKPCVALRASTPKRGSLKSALPSLLLTTASPDWSVRFALTELRPNASPIS